MRQRNHPNLFFNLPSEIIIGILSRLPVRTIISCKCVCKSWLNLVDTLAFAKTHLSKAVPGLAVCQFNSKVCKIYEFEDGLDVEHHELHYNPVTTFNLPCRAWISGSAIGLLLLYKLGEGPDSLYICNPITRDYIKLDCPRYHVASELNEVTYGFGVSKITGQHKVVRILQNYYGYDPKKPHRRTIISGCVCDVYTIGTGSWRRVAPVSSLLHDQCSTGEFLNGNLHWLMSRLRNSQLWISCLDLETELFSTFSPPPYPHAESKLFDWGLFALGNCLSFCDNTSDDEIDIWLMKEYGVEKSWTKAYVISKNPVVFNAYATENIHGVVTPIKVFEDGDILMQFGTSFLFYYSKKNTTTQVIDMFGPDKGIIAHLHTPSFLSLKSFGMENVISF